MQSQSLEVMHNVSLSHMPTSNLQVFKNLSSRDISVYFLLTLSRLSHHHPHLDYVSALQTVLCDPLWAHPSSGTNVTAQRIKSTYLSVSNSSKVSCWYLAMAHRVVWYGCWPFPSPFSLPSSSRFSSSKMPVLPHLKAHAISLPGKMFSPSFAWFNLMNLNFRAHWNISSSERHSVSSKLDLVSYIYVLITSSWNHKIHSDISQCILLGMTHPSRA